jgi:hypothetical protein
VDYLAFESRRARFSHRKLVKLSGGKMIELLEKILAILERMEARQISHDNIAQGIRTGGTDYKRQFESGNPITPHSVDDTF